MNTREQWQKPELIILARSRPEENVLTSCKTSARVDNPAKSGQTCASSPCSAVTPS